MNSKKIVLIAFILVALVQLYIPAKMIFDSEEVLGTGKEYKFKTAPIDPNDPFRGKYIRLHYEENTVEVDNTKEWTVGEEIYVYLTINNGGFAEIQSVSKDKPSNSQDYLKATVDMIQGNGTGKLSIHYPFDRYYLEESKAPEAERTYTESLRDTTKLTYALVNIKNGEAVLKDVMIDGMPIKDIILQKK